MPVHVLTHIQPIFLSWKCCLFVLMFYAPVKRFPVMSGWFPIFLGWTSTKQRIKYLAKGHNTVTPAAVSLELATVWSPVQPSTNWATALTFYLCCIYSSADLDFITMNPMEAVWSGFKVFPKSSDSQKWVHIVAI